MNWKSDVTDMRERVAKVLCEAAGYKWPDTRHHDHYVSLAESAIEAAGAAKMLDALKMVMQHGRIDDSEERMNLVASIIAQVEKRKDA